MARILITGMSGTGKSAVVEELARLGHRAIDLDAPAWSHWVEAPAEDMLTPRPGRDWVWRMDRVRALLSQHAGADLFVSGCAENMGGAFELIDLIVLLSAPPDTIMERLAARSGDGYGQSGAERAAVARLIEAVEPRLRAAAQAEIDTRQPVGRTVETILAIAATVRLD
ncbi:AAA family ATPase [Roseomonas terrae]|uniref:AAA family ATPase n=1 Tax=Neoroseomonas terrae TaxID=424799 RepID=A0ABS5EHS4_9PROT|nr:AAA family ATPase [Neoroseomonas terrae]MBR0650580.1 AAA family ATPase [Neoroseomonas terrae]